MGGNGAPGEAGAGGTIKIAGSVVASTATSVNVQGGFDPLSLSPNGGDGRFLFGSNSGSFSGSLTGGTELAFAGPMRSNPLIAGGPQTPFIPELVGGAEAFGLTTLTSADFASVVAGAPTGAVAALVLQHVGPTGYGDAFPGFDVLFFVNLLNQSLLDPRLGAGSAMFTDTLLQEGFANDPLFGGGGALVLSQLGPGQVYATLVPIGTTVFNASLLLGAMALSGSTTSLAGGPLYLITKVDQTISFGPLANHTYGDPPFAVSATASSGLPVCFAVVSGPATAFGDEITVTGAGTVVVEASQASNAVYNAAPVVDQSFTVNPASLKITADNQIKAYGATVPPLTSTPSGFVNGDTAAVLSGSPSLTTTATASSPPNTYPITAGPGTLSAANYRFTFVSGTLTVTAAPLSATGVKVSATAGAPFTAPVAAFRNADPFGSPDSYTATISWGDGSASTGTITDSGGGTFTVTGGHTYTDPGDETVRVTIRHTLGYTTTATTSSTAFVTSLSMGVQTGQSAGIGFWQNNNGQALIESLNGGPASTALSRWLARTLPNLYGANAGSHNLTGETTAQVAAFYVSLFNQQGPKLDTQVLATALNVYATTLSLGGMAARAYGFTVTADGLGASSYNVGADGGAFGVANQTTLTVFALLADADRLAVNGLLDNGDATLRREALDVFGGINSLGGL
jgi:hypothetical protein